MTLADKLNKYQAHYNHEENEVEFVPGDDDCDSEGYVIDPELNEFFDGVTGRLDYHPYGRDGGYVAWAEYKGEAAWYDERGECCWLAR